MPVLDDSFLEALFDEAGAAFAPPPTGVDDIVRRTRGDHGDTDTGDTDTGDTDSGDAGAAGQLQLPTTTDPVRPTSPRRTIGGTLGAHRRLTVAAAVIVVAAIAAVSVTLGHRATGPGRAVAPSSGVAGPATAPAAPLPSTTVPAAPQGAGGAPFRAIAPSSTTGPAHGSVSPSPLPSTGGATTPATIPDGQSAKIAQTGTLVLRVPRGALSSTIAALTALAAQAQGMVASSYLDTNVVAPQGTITLQVPVAGFPAVVHQAQALGRSQKLTTKATDVTGSYVDLQARIDALDTSRQQYLTILAKATSISDILAVQSQLDSLQSQIEQLQGQLALLTNQTTYSSLTVVVHEPAPAHPHRSGAPTGIDRAWHDSLHGFVAGVDGVVGLAGPLLFAGLLAGLVLLAGRLLWRRWQRHNL